jgi:hypothetical protein
MGYYHLRSKQAGGPTYYELTPDEIAYELQGVEDTSAWYISAMAPSHLTTFQGEVCCSERGLDLTYTFVAKPMRPALAEETLHANGYKARCLLAKYMNPTCHDWLYELFNLYPNHTIEFSCYSTNWGTVPHCNTVFWEVRMYMLLALVFGLTYNTAFNSVL